MQLIFLERPQISALSILLSTTDFPVLDEIRCYISAPIDSELESMVEIFEKRDVRLDIDYVVEDSE